MLLRSMPDLSPQNTRFRAWFYERWGRENCIILGCSRNAEYATFRQRLSIKMARGGAERYFVDNRSLLVDDDNYLVLNDSRSYGSLIRAERDVESFSIFFRPGLLEEVLGAASAPTDSITEPATARTIEFPEQLQPHDRTVSPVMRFIRHHILLGVEDEGWYEEQLQVLAVRMLQQQRRIRQQALRLDCIKSSTRQELSRRLALAADYIHSNYDRDLTPVQIATVACLSVHHFIRLFRAAYGLTPMQFLQRKRIRSAAHLMSREPDRPVQEIAAQVGFSSRATFYRQLRRWRSS